ncbi:MAG: metallophosphoesterase [Woeseiaceae bacterium]
MMTRSWTTRVLCLIAPLTLFLGACANYQPSDVAGTESVGILIFGDTGYHLDYPDQDDYVDLFTQEGFHQAEWDDWLEDKRPKDQFEARPSSVSPVTGKVVPATGMHAIAAAMAHYCGNITVCDFGVMLGDNIYPSGATLGADGFDDADRFRHMFTEPFGNFVKEPTSYLTYVTLGNHDWETSRAGGFAQIEFHEKSDGFYMDGPFYTVKPPAGKGDIELFIVDTSMILASTTVRADYLNDDGSEVVTHEIESPDYRTEMLTDAEKNQPQWLEDALRNSTAKWKFVIAHHPIWSSSGSKFEQARVLRKMILPAMCRYADAYVVGHDHTLEIHTDSCKVALGEEAAEPLVQIVSGAGAKQRPIHTSFMAHQERKYPEHKTVMAEGLLWGFAHMTLKGDKAEVTMMSVPDDGSADISVNHIYEFKRRSHLSK